MKCTQCGNEIPDGSKFCNSCGAKVEIEIPKENQAEQRSTGVKKFLKEKKEWVIGYAVWFVINFTLFLLGGVGYTKREFFPFEGDISSYDISELFVYVIALPVVAYAVYYLYDNYYLKKKVKLPKISSRVAMWCLPLAFVISLIVYDIAMKPVEHYAVTPHFNNGRLMRKSVHMDVHKAEIPSFLGDTYDYTPYKRLFTYKRYPLYHLSYNEELYYPKMPLPFRLRVAFMIMCSWKGLRFFILMWLLSYGIVMFMKLKEIKLPKISSKVAKWCIPLAFVISLIVYAIAMKPSEQYTVDESGNVSVDVISKAKIPSFLGETHHYFPYDTILSYRGYPTYTPTRNEGLHCPKMPLLFRLRVALMIMYSWEGLRFFILMWLLSYGIVMFIKSKTQFNLKGGIQSTQTSSPLH